MTDEAALASYLSEPPRLYRNRKKSKPPEGYIMYGPLDVHDAMEELVRAEPTLPMRTQVKLPAKARRNAQELDEAVYLYSQDSKERRILKGLGQDAPMPKARATEEPHAPIVEHAWHAQARVSPASEGVVTKRHSQPLRTFQSKSSGSGMRYKGPEEGPAPEIPSHTSRQPGEIPSVEAVKRRSTPLRKFPPKVGSTFPSGRPPGFQ